MSFEEFIEMNDGTEGLEDCNSVDDFEEAVSLVTDKSLEELYEEYNAYCDEEGEMLSLPDFLDDYFTNN